MAETEQRRRARILLLVEVLAVAGALTALTHRLASKLQEQLGLPLNADVAQFVAGARHSTFFYDSLLREPLHAFVLKMVLWFPLGEEHAVRLATFGETLLAAGCLYWVGRRCVGRLPALAALWVYCGNWIVIFFGVGGLRSPLLATTVLLFAGVLLRARSDRPLTWGLLLGLTSAGVGLTRVYSLALPVVGFAALALELRGWRAGRRRPVLILGVTAALVSAVLVAPWFLVQTETHISKDMMKMAAFEKRGDGTILPGDEPVTPLEYFLEGRTPQEIVGRTAGNYVLYLTKYLPYFLKPHGWAAALLPLGLLVACRSRRRLLAAAWVGSLIPIVFVLNLDLHAPGSGVENRLVLHVFPLSLLLMAHGCAWIVVRAVAAVARLAKRDLPVLWTDVARDLLPAPDEGEPVTTEPGHE